MVPDARKALLAPPREAAKARFFPDAVWEEDRDYLVGALEAEGAREGLAHDHRGAYRTPDEVGARGMAAQQCSQRCTATATATATTTTTTTTTATATTATATTATATATNNHYH